MSFFNKVYHTVFNHLQKDGILKTWKQIENFVSTPPKQNVFKVNISCEEGNAGCGTWHAFAFPDTISELIYNGKHVAKIGKKKFNSTLSCDRKLTAKGILNTTKKRCSFNS